MILTEDTVRETTRKWLYTGNADAFEEYYNNINWDSYIEAGNRVVMIHGGTDRESSHITMLGIRVLGVLEEARDQCSRKLRKSDVLVIESPDKKNLDEISRLQREIIEMYFSSTHVISVRISNTN